MLPRFIFRRGLYVSQGSSCRIPGNAEGFSCFIVTGGVDWRGARLPAFTVRGKRGGLRVGSSCLTGAGFSRLAAVKSVKSCLRPPGKRVLLVPTDPSPSGSESLRICWPRTSPPGKRVNLCDSKGSDDIMLSYLEAPAMSLDMRSLSIILL